MKKFESIYQDATLLRKALLGEAGETELAELEKRLAESSELRKVYGRLQNEETVKESFEAYKTYSSKKAYHSFLQIIGQKRAKERKHRILWVSGCVVAATVALAVVFSFYLLNYSSEREMEKTLILPGSCQAQLTLSDGEVIDVAKKSVNVVVDGVRVEYERGVLSYQSIDTVRQEAKSMEEELPVRSNELVIPCGGENKVILSDGTAVYLNAGSKLVYPVRFAGKRRIVRLEGEGYFDVKTDEVHPFVVQTRLGEVTVLGTSFNVNAYPDAPVYTTLVRGKVQFSSLDAKESVTLLPGEQAVISADGLEKREVDLEEYVGWVSGLYVFKERSLGEIMNTFERWYNIRVYYETPELRDITYSGSLKRYETVNSFLDALELTGDLTYRVSGRDIWMLNKVE